MLHDLLMTGSADTVEMGPEAVICSSVTSVVRSKQRKKTTGNSNGVHVAGIKPMTHDREHPHDVTVLRH